MSDFKFPCPKCGQNILCDTSNAGMQIPCPVCQTVLTVPPPPPAVPVAGKLSINKTAHHPPPPPPGAANAPGKPAWGAKPPPPPPKKKSFLPAIGTFVALAAVGAIVWFMFGAPYLQKRAEEQKQAEEQKRQQEEAQRKAAAEAARPKPPKAVWKLDLASTPFPDRPAAGKLHGVDFTVETVLFQNGFLTLRQDTGSSRQFVISVPLKSGETLPGKTIEVTATNTLNQPHVGLNWKDDTGKPPGMQNFVKGYAMKLEFGAVADGNVPGKIFLCVPDPEQSFVAGNFLIAPKKIPGQSAAATMPVPTRGGPPAKRRGE